MTVAIRLLGDVEVDVPHRAIDLGHRRQRCVLAALAVDANRTVPLDQLVLRVWGEQAPKRARESIYSYVSRLRQVLGDSPELRIERRSGGYSLRLDPAAVDLHRFRQLVSRARTAIDQSAVASLTEAIELWRGEPFAALDTPWLNEVREGLRQELFEAQLHRNDVMLRLGMHGELLSRLTAQAAGSPFDERLTAQLMLALYRAGRSAEAMNHYRLVRERLVDELGTEPGEALQRLHKQILVRDPSLDPPAPCVARPETVPRQLPWPPRGFAGRAAELDRLDAIMHAAGATRPVIAVIGGPGGIGKTWLAVHWAQLRRDRFPDGQLYVNLRGFDHSGTPVRPEEAVRGLLDALSVPPGNVPDGLEAQLGLYRSTMADRRMILVLDNARDSAQVTPLLPGSSTCPVLVTSRNRLPGLVTGYAAVPLELDVFTPEQSRELVTGRLGAHRITTEREAFVEMLDRCAGLPLALAIVSARAIMQPQLPLTALADDLRAASTRLDALGADELTADLRTVFSWSYRALDARTARAFGLLGLAPGPDIALPAAASLFGEPVATTRVLLRDLTDASLVQQHSADRYRMHDLVRLYAREGCERDQAAEHNAAAVRRVVDFYLHTACAGERVLRPHSEPIELSPPSAGCEPLALPDPGSAMRWFGVEHGSLLAALREAERRRWYPVVWQLAWGLDTFHFRRGRRADNVACWRAALAAAGHSTRPTDRILATRRLGRACSTSGDSDEALRHLGLALDLAERAGDDLSRAHVHITTGWAWELAGDDGRALAHCERALPLFAASRADDWEGITLNAIGWYLAKLGRFAEARTRCEDALALFRRRGSRTAEAATLDSLGYIAHQSGRHLDAVECYRGTLVIYREFGDRYSEADTLNRLGEAYAAAHQPEPARRCWTEALDLYFSQRRLSDAEDMRRCLTRLLDDRTSPAAPQ